MNFVEFSFALFSLSSFKEFNKLYLLNLGKETENKILNLVVIEDSRTILILYA